MFTILSIFVFLSDAFAEETQDNLSRLDSLTKFTKVINIVEKYYVDEQKIDEVVDKAIQGLMTNLDAHSSYLQPKKYKELKIQTEGEFGGLGITVGMKDGALTVISPIEGTPADKAGLKAHDIILKIDDRSTLNMTIDEAVGLMRGKPNSKVVLTLVRKKEPKPFPVEITRDIIKVPSVYAKRILGDDLLYIRVTSFDKKVTNSVREEIVKSKTWMKGIVLDLRNNPGGLLDQAVDLVDLFVEDGVIVSQKGRAEKENRVFNATSKGTITGIPLAVLVNEGSASASEIVSGALQDHKKAVIIGQKTFGKGSVQIILPIDGTEALRLTIARYYLPSGRTIQSTGVTPDISVAAGEVPHETDEFKIKEAELKHHLEGELEKIDGADAVKKIKETEEESDDDKTTITQEKVLQDIQLKTAIDVIKTWQIINPS